MIGKMLENCVYEGPSSIYTKAYCAVTFLFLIYLAVSEVIGSHLQYSKFYNSGSKKSKQILLPSKIGMLILYTPAFFAGVSSFWLFPNGGIRFLMLKSAGTIHFFKRDLEVLFLHKFSGFMGLGSVILISALYFTSVASMVYFQLQTLQIPEPSIDLKYFGILVFFIGILGNFYHHYLLSKLRDKNEKGYKIPRGGLFSLVICPHYLFEIIGFFGISFICQTIFSYLCAIGVFFYLLARSHVTRNWYLSKFENFPKNVKALIPYVF